MRSILYTYLQMAQYEYMLLGVEKEALSLRYKKFR